MEKSPNSRFKEYTDVWKPSKLSQIATRITRKNDALESDLVLTISAQYGLIDQNDFFNKRIASNLLQGYFLMRKGEFAYNKSYSSEYPVGAVKRLNNYDMGVLSTLYILFTIQDEPLAEWIEHFFETSKWHNEIIKRASEGARNHGLLNISPADFFDLPFLYPSSEIEQHKIAQFFSRFDALIIAEDKKLEKLRNLKNASLVKMFPNKGESVPMVRFKGFAGEWEEHTLSDFLTVVAEKNEEGLYNKNDIFSVSNECGVINQIKYQGKSLAGASLLNYKVTHKDTVIYTKSPLKNQPYGIIKANKDCSGIVSALYAVYSVDKKVWPEFIEVYFASDNRLNDYLRPIVNKGAKNTLLVSDEGALVGKVVFPADKKEQQSIVSFFSRIDSLTTVHEQRVEKLRSMKKAFLEKMFVTAQ